MGLGDFAPSNPCAKSTKAKPGSCSKKLEIGSRQMDGFRGSFGSPECSRTPQPSAHARQIIRSIKKMSSSFPTATWDNSFRAKEGRPQRSSRDLNGLGSLPIEASNSANLPWLQVSQGGSQRPPWTWPECSSEPKNFRLYIAGVPPLLTNDHVHWDHVKNEPVAIPRKGRFQIMLEISWPSASRKCV